MASIFADTKDTAENTWPNRCDSVGPRNWADDIRNFDAKSSQPVLEADIIPNLIITNP